MLLFLIRFLFGFALSLSSVALLAVTTWLCLKILALLVLMPVSRRVQDAAGALTVLVLIAAALAALYGVGHLLYGHMGAWPAAAAGQTDGWLAGPRLISPEALLGALAGFGGLAAAPGLWRGLIRFAASRAGLAAASSAATGKPNAEDKSAKPAKAEKAAAKSSKSLKATAPAREPKRPTIPQLGWLALFLLAIGAVLLAFATIVAPLEPASGLMAALHGAGRLMPVYVCALVLFGGGLLCLLLWRICRRSATAASR